MAHGRFFFGAEQIGMDGIAREGLQGKRGDELLTASGHDNPYAGARFNQ
jgi:hypothetical protein